MISLRPVEPPDVELFFLYQQDEELNTMQAFGPANPADRTGHDERWAKMTSLPEILVRTILSRDEVCGFAVSFIMEGRREVGYLLGKEYWGRGIATEALRHFLLLLPERPLWAVAAEANIGSRRVLAKNGFLPMEEFEQESRWLGRRIPVVAHKLSG